MSTQSPPVCHVYRAPPARSGPGAGILVTGGRHGGTSAIAGVLRILGVDMGVGLAAVNEDQEIVNRWARRHIPLMNEVPGVREMVVKEVREVLSKRKSWPAPWGWKDPLCTYYAEDVLDLLPKPRLVIVWRDPLASVVRTEGDRPGTVGKDLRERLEHYHACLDIADRHWIPTLLVSYERAIQDPHALIEPLYTFCGLNPNPDQLKNAPLYIAPRQRYQDVAPLLDESTARKQR